MSNVERQLIFGEEEAALFALQVAQQAIPLFDASLQRAVVVGEALRKKYVFATTVRQLRVLPTNWQVWQPSNPLIVLPVAVVSEHAKHLLFDPRK